MPIAKRVEALSPYVPGEQPKAKNVVKLNTNENPYPPSPQCAKILAAFDLERLRKYPDPVFCELRKEIAKRAKCGPECVFVGNGSDEILALAAKAFVEDAGALASLDPSYSLYKTIAAIRGVSWTGVKTLEDFDTSAKDAPELFLLTNPNAPTGEFIEPDAIAKFAKRYKGTLLVDEAYADFARANAMPLAVAPRNKNVIVMRTFSKSYSLAGLRVGYCVGPRPLIDALYKIKDSYNVDAIAQSVALAAFKDRRWMLANAAKIKKTRKAFTAALVKRGWDVIKSESNFVFAKPPLTPAKDIFLALKKANIFVRYFDMPNTSDRLRITIGTDDEMSRLLDALDKMGV